MKSIFEQLYTNYYSYSVIPEMCVAGYNGKNEMGLKHNVDEFRDNVIWSKHFFDERGVNEIAFINKLSPHSLYDCMLMCMEKENSSISDLSDEAAKFVFEMTYKFIEFVSEKQIMDEYDLYDGYMHICYNYDPFTIDRESGMSEKRFHLHMNYWRKRDISLDDTKYLGEICDKNLVRRMVDPLTIIGEYVLYDMLKYFKIEENILEPNISRDIEYGLPIGLKIKYDGCEVLKSFEFSKKICKLHILLCDIYNEFEKIFCININRNGKWKRSLLKNVEEIKQGILKSSWLSEYSRLLMFFLAENLRNINSIPEKYFLENRDGRIRHLCMNGLNYSLSFFSPNENSAEIKLINQRDFYLVIQPKMFSDIGGAGLPCIGGIAAAKLKRNAIGFTEKEAEMRDDFHKRFIKYI